MKPLSASHPDANYASQGLGLSAPASVASLPIRCKAVRLRGSVYLEYLSVVLVLVFALFSPLPGTGGNSVFDFALGALKQFGSNTAQLLAMP